LHLRLESAELFNSFLEYKKNTGSCQTSTLNNYGRWGKPILSFCGDMDVDEFTKYHTEIYGLYLNHRKTNRQQFQKFTRDGKDYTGRRLSPILTGTTLNGELTLFHMVLSYGKYNLGLFDDWSIPPLTHHRLPQNDNITCPTQPEYVQMKRFWIEKNRPEIEIGGDETYGR